MSEIKLTINQSKILLFLEQVDPPFRFARYISTKMHMDYGYLIRRLKQMESDGWIKATKADNKVFYHNKEKAPIKEAKELLER